MKKVVCKHSLYGKKGVYKIIFIHVNWWIIFSVFLEAIATKVVCCLLYKTVICFPYGHLFWLKRNCQSWEGIMNVITRRVLSTGKRVKNKVLMWALSTWGLPLTFTTAEWAYMRAIYNVYCCVSALIAYFDDGLIEWCQGGQCRSCKRDWQDGGSSRYFITKKQNQKSFILKAATTKQFKSKQFNVWQFMR